MGVNPDLLQFYISSTNERKNFMSGYYHRYYVSGVVDGFSLQDQFVSLQLPSFHIFTRNVFYSIHSSCIRDSTILSNCITDAAVLTKYAYTVEVEPLPSFAHSLQCMNGYWFGCVDSLVERSSLYFLMNENHWIVPWSMLLYEEVTLWGSCLSC